MILITNGEKQVRAWCDRKTGCLMQAEEMKDGKARRRLWGTRIRKFDGRWFPNVLEVETLGSGHRTKIIVESLKRLEPTPDGKTPATATASSERK